MYAPADIRPVNDEKQTVKSSGVEVAIPAIFPIVFGFKFNSSASSLYFFTKIYFEINTISPEYIINLEISKIIFMLLFTFIFPNFLPIIIKYSIMGLL